MDQENERRKANLSKSVGVGGHVGQDDEDVLLELVRVVLGGGESKSRSNDTFDTVSHSDQSGSNNDDDDEAGTDVGSLAKLRKRVTRSNEPFSSKSCRKNRAVSILTPIAAKTMEKLSSCPSWIPLVGAASGFRSVDNLLTKPACRQI